MTNAAVDESADAGTTGAPLDYEWDVFLSYARGGMWMPWVRDYFFEVFCHWLSTDLGRQVRVFVDYQAIAGGAAYPARLAQGLSRSRVLVPLLSPLYFGSGYCRTELSLMWGREQLLGLATENLPEGLILPIRLHDGDKYPLEVQARQALDLSSCANVMITPQSPKREELSEKIRDWIPHVVDAMSRAPAQCDPAWSTIAYQSFEAQFHGRTLPAALPSLG